MTKEKTYKWFFSFTRGDKINFSAVNTSFTHQL